MIPFPVLIDKDIKSSSVTEIDDVLSTNEDRESWSE